MSTSESTIEKSWMRFNWVKFYLFIIDNNKILFAVSPFLFWIFSCLCHVWHACPCYICFLNIKCLSKTKISQSTSIISHSTYGNLTYSISDLPRCGPSPIKFLSRAILGLSLGCFCPKSILRRSVSLVDVRTWGIIPKDWPSRWICPNPYISKTIPMSCRCETICSQSNSTIPPDNECPCKHMLHRDHNSSPRGGRTRLTWSSNCSLLLFFTAQTVDTPYVK